MGTLRQRCRSSNTRGAGWAPAGTAIAMTASPLAIARTTFNVGRMLASLSLGITCCEVITQRHCPSWRTKATSNRGINAQHSVGKM